MAGYTRQSIGDIINGLEITAPPLNAEFNQIDAAFDEATGHTHDGSAGNGPKINLQTSVSGYLPAEHGGMGGKNNLSATTNPLVTNDVSEGYAVGSMWENINTGRVFLCVGNFTGAAVWRELVVYNNTVQAIRPETTDTMDLGSPSNRFQDLYLAGGMTGQGNGSVGGTWSVTGQLNANGGSVLSGLTTAAQVDVNSGTIDNTVIGGTSASPITGTTITSTGGFIGDLTGDVTGDVTSANTSTFNNLTVSGTATGTFQGDITGNITSSGLSTFNNVTISGTLNMDGATTATIQNLTEPTNPQDAATKNYVDTGLADLVSAAPATLDTLNELAEALGDDENFSTTMANALAGKVADTGDTMTGNLVMSGATVTGLPLPTAGTQAASKAYTDQQDALQVSRAGDTMSGSLGMGGNKITNMGTPTVGTDAATKAYTDGILGSATAASASAAAAATSEANAAISEANASQSESDARDWAIKTDGTVDGVNYSSKYWATRDNVLTVSSNITDVNTVATDIANVSLAAGSIDAVNTVATNINNVNDFFDTYFVGANQPVGDNVTEGDLWFDTSAQVLKVRSSSGFQNAGSSVNGTAERQDYEATAGQTSFAAVYDPTYVDVYLNGVKLAPSDFTATDGANVVLASAAAAGDTVSIVSFGTFELADHYNRTTVDALIDDVETLALAGI